ncbi:MULTISPECIES: DMT family transporter [unclassified Flavobacterium]|uniref:DMT family transporter n=1 Tax=unclassified Flavobacterium TaxID=196869 RepID=UPI000F0C6F8B|nr:MULTISPECIES: DMT family transporter [unclassified Flavobacterium]AYN03782.1 DMT family transporter [Flavobacterium sp. 140616W15]MCD0476671.1 DMT family transporter [Flavobacterium sp. EDS]
MKIKGYLFAIISAVSYGLIPLFILPIKAINFPMDTVLFYRFFVSSLFLLAYLIYKKESLKVNTKELLILLLLGLFYALSAEFLFLGYDYLSPGIASTILFVYPVIVALTMFFFFKERINKLTIISLFITICGVFALSTKGSAFNINFIGLVVTLTSALFYALYIIVVNKAKIKASSIKITFYSLLFSSLYYLCKVLLFNESMALPDVMFFLEIVVFALVTTVLSMSTLVYAIKTIGSTATSIMGALEPVVAVAVSVILFNENLTMSLILGGCLIISGVIINIVSEAVEKVRSTEIQKQ